MLDLFDTALVATITPVIITRIGNDTGGIDSVLQGSGNISEAVKAETTSSAIYNLDIVEISFYLKKTGSPTGTVSFQMQDGSHSLVQEYGTHDVSTLSTSYTKITKTGTAQTMGENYYLVAKYTGGDGSNNISVERVNSNVYDGSNTIRAREDSTSSWADDSSRDVRFEIGYI